MLGQHCVKLIYGILGSPGANIFHLYLKGVLPWVSHEGTPTPPSSDSSGIHHPLCCSASKWCSLKQGLNLKEHHHCGNSLLWVNTSLPMFCFVSTARPSCCSLSCGDPVCCINPEPYVASADRVTNDTFYYCGKEQPGVARKMDLQGNGRSHVKV